MDLRLVGVDDGGGGWLRKSGQFRGQERRSPSSHPSAELIDHAEISRGLLALVRKCCTVLGVIDGGAQGKHQLTDRAVDAFSGMDPASSAMSARPISADVDAWENERRRLNRRGIKGDRLRLQEVIGGCGWTRVEQATAESFLPWLADQRAPDAKGSVRWKGATANKIVSTFLADVHRRTPGRCPINWARGLERASTDDSDDGSRPLTWAEFCRFSEWVLKDSPYRFDAYMVMVYTGMRYREARLLSIAEVMLDGLPRIELTRRTKKKKKRTIPVNEIILPVLKKLIGNRASGLVFLPRSQGGEGFPTVRTLRRDCRRAGVDPKDVGFHSLRKCFAGRLALTGVPLAVAAKLLGHDDPQLTANIYSRFEVGELADQIAKLGESSAQPKKSSRENLTMAHASGDTHDAQTDQTMESTTSQSRISAPGRIGLHRTSEQRASLKSFRPGTVVRDRTEPRDSLSGIAAEESHLRDLNPGPMLYESIALPLS
jgi:integrase